MRHNVSVREPALGREGRGGSTPFGTSATRHVWSLPVRSPRRRREQFASRRAVGSRSPVTRELRRKKSRRGLPLLPRSGSVLFTSPDDDRGGAGELPEMPEDSRICRRDSPGDARTMTISPGRALNRRGGRGSQEAANWSVELRVANKESGDPFHPRRPRSRRSHRRRRGRNHLGQMASRLRRSDVGRVIENALGAPGADHHGDRRRLPRIIRIEGRRQIREARTPGFLVGDVAHHGKATPAVKAAAGVCWYEGPRRGHCGGGFLGFSWDPRGSSRILHPADLVVIVATAGRRYNPASSWLLRPAVLDEQVRNLREAREALRKTLSVAVDERMDAALAVARVAAESAREGERLAALAEDLRRSAERLRGEMDSISRLLNDDRG